jgi:hypothetical protein
MLVSTVSGPRNYQKKGGTSAGETSLNPPGNNRT